MTHILVVRPEPGASATAIRARRLGLEAVVAPIFTIRSLAWKAPPAEAFDALLLTSANAARHAGPELARFTGLPCYAVGEATAAAAEAAGLADVRAGTKDAAAALALIEDGAHILHLCGRDHIAAERPGLSITRVPVYAAEPADKLAPEAADAVRLGALVLLHSPRGAALFARLADEARLSRSDISIAAISEAAAQTAGGGWRSAAAAPRLSDDALLELAVKLCQTAPMIGRGAKR